MTFSINPNIPAAANTPSADQPRMQQNFQSINSFLGIDHTPPGTTPNAGQHNYVRFSTNVSASSPPTPPSLGSPGAVSEIFASVGPSLSQLWFYNGTGNPIQMTVIIPTTSSGVNHGIITPFGLILNWGNIPGVNPVATDVTFAVPFNTFQSVVLTTENTVPDSYLSVSNTSNTTFKAYCSVNSHTVFYFAIGV